MTGVPHPERRYYTRMARIMDPVTGECSDMRVGLVGLHIVQKTPTRPQWIWSTFEQVDNVPSSKAQGGGIFAFNDGSATPMPSTRPKTLAWPPKIPVPPPTNIERLS